LPEAWSDCGEYRFGVDLFNRAFLWEAHEAWEVVWIGAGKQSVPARFVQGLIQVAAALLRAHVGTPAGARTLLIKATRRFESVERRLQSTGGTRYMGVDLAAWRPSVWRYLESGGDYPFLRLFDSDG